MTTRIFYGLIALLVACGGTPMPAAGRGWPMPSGRPSSLYVGTERVDVTPPPGVSTFGHGPDAHVANGYWTRLYCRVFVIETAESGPIALAPCDLAATSTLLHRAVSARLSDLVPASRILITATHTHAGPAHYFEGEAYSGATSTQLPGFDENMVAFLSSRIAGAIRSAHSKRAPARARWLHDSLWGITRNRSLTAFKRNSPSFEPRTPPAPGLPDDQRLVDPAIDIIQFESVETTASPCPVGWLVFFALHPTVLPHGNRLLGADADGVASREVERVLRTRAASAGRPNADPLAGIVHTNAGDISAVRGDGTRTDALRVGEAIASKAMQMDSADPVAPNTQAAVDIRYLELNLPGRRLQDGVHRLGKKAALGAAAAKGADDHLSEIGKQLSVILSWFPQSSDEAQAPKRPLVAGQHMFPERVPITLMRLANVWLSFVPCEMTITAGQRITRAVLRATGQPSTNQALIVSNTNGYLQYVTTVEEYQVQAYEGASNLYGRWTAEALRESFELLALSMAGQDVSPWLAGSFNLDEATSFEYFTGPSRARLSRGDGDTPLSELGALRKPIGLCRIGHDIPPAFCFQWVDGSPGIVPLSPGPWVQTVQNDDARSPIPYLDDRTSAFETRVHQGFAGAWLWTTVFRPSHDDWNEILTRGETRIRIRHKAPIPSIESPPLAPHQAVPDCTEQVQRQCEGAN